MHTKSALIVLFCTALFLVRLTQAYKFSDDFNFPPQPSDGVIKQVTDPAPKRPLLSAPDQALDDQGVKIPNCAEYNTKGECTRCTQGFGLNGSLQCEKCADLNCASCGLDSNICKICNTGYGVNKNGKCETCSDKNCVHCGPNSSICTKCKAGYKLKSDGPSCEINCSIKNCTRCKTDAAECIECNPGYGVNQAHECVECADKNCVDCRFNSTICTKCKAGYKLKSDGPSCEIDCKIDNCKKCKDSQKCASCSEGYELRNEGQSCVKSHQGASQVSGPLLIAVVSALATAVLL